MSGTKEKYVVDVWSGNHPFFQVLHATLLGTCTCKLITPQALPVLVCRPHSALHAMECVGLACMGHGMACMGQGMAGRQGIFL